MTNDTNYREGWDSVASEDTGARLDNDEYEALLDARLRVRPERIEAEDEDEV